jgi:acetyl-CoA acetyltransferase
MTTLRDLLADVAIVGAANTKQARTLPGETSNSLAIKAASAALADAGLSLDEVDGFAPSATASSLIYDLRLGPAWNGANIGNGVAMVVEAAIAIATGQCSTVLIAAGDAGKFDAHSPGPLPWTVPGNEFTAPWGATVPAQFALVARRHMTVFGTTERQLATVSATIRNNGSVNPDAVYYGRGSYTADDVLQSRMVADPFHLLDCATASEGGSAMVLTSRSRSRDTRATPVSILGAAHDVFGPGYRFPPSFDLSGRRADQPVNGYVGQRAASRAFAMAGLRPCDVDVLELYDPYSFEVIRQLEAYGFCPVGEGGPFVNDGHIRPDGRYPVTTDGGTMAFGHSGGGTNGLQRVIRAVMQVRGDCASRQIPGAEVALASNAGSAALMASVVLIGRSPR